MKAATTIQRRLPWRTASLWLAAGAASATLLPGASAYAIMWSACRLNCSSFGWLALTYAQGAGYLCAAVLIAVLGMRSYTLVAAKAAPHQNRRLQLTFVLIAAAGALLMVISPYLPPTSTYLGEIAKYIALHH